MINIRSARRIRICRHLWPRSSSHLSLTCGLRCRLCRATTSRVLPCRIHRLLRIKIRTSRSTWINSCSKTANNDPTPSPSNRTHLQPKERLLLLSPSRPPRYKKSHRTPSLRTSRGRRPPGMQPTRTLAARHLARRAIKISTLCSPATRRMRQPKWL